MPRPKKTTTKQAKKGVERAPKNAYYPPLVTSGWIQAPDFVAKYQHESTHLLPEGKEFAVKPEPSMSEIDFLAIFVDNFEQYDDPTKDRIMAYLSDRYRKHIYYNQKD